MDSVLNTLLQALKRLETELNRLNDNPGGIVRLWLDSTGLVTAHYFTREEPNDAWTLKAWEPDSLVNLENLVVEWIETAFMEESDG